MPTIKATQPQYDFLQNEARFRAFVGGVGSGKTYAGCLASLHAARDSERGAVVAPTYPMLKDAVIPTWNELADGGMAGFNKAEMRATMNNGAEVLFRSADKPDRLRGTNLGWFWMDEAALCGEEVWDILLGRLRLDPGTAWITTTPRGHNWVYDTFVQGESADYSITRSSSTENPHLPDAFLDSLERKYTERFRRQEVEGEFIAVEGALWNWDIIDYDANPPGMDRIVIGVDPAGGGPDEVGILVCGKSGGHAYVLDDASMKGSPNAWASAVASAYRRHEADRIVAERNYGGDMVESTLRTADAHLPVDVISASRGKQQRAEPVAALYEQGKVHHVGRFNELEDQMTTWDPQESSESPDRVDALVWAFTELMLTGNEPGFVIA
jgi:predicted phage terminase large subunit-like protein